MSARVSISDAKAIRSDSVAISGERRLADNAENTEERNWFMATIGKLRGKTKEPLSPEEPKAALTKILNDNQHGKVDDFFKDIRKNPRLIDDALKNKKVISVLNSFEKKEALNENDIKKLHKVILKELTANDGNNRLIEYPFGPEDEQSRRQQGQYGQFRMDQVDASKED
ncbi:hypothetical protein CCR75_000873 [Bremia lactucae]|uniref:Uncharacterized protein n=1 Tax=Bremia lactucae TaxID=4779 RepID=A0A976FP87_BRELC|nr:hypothetical protein CCR75_000873 [Bremia lactucae]